MSPRGPRWIAPARRVLVGLGTIIIGYGVWGAATDGGVKPLGQAEFLAVLLFGHDLFFLPLVILAGAIAGWVVPASARTVVWLAGVVSVAVTVVAMPFVLGFGRRPDDPSAFPQDYNRNLLIILALVWALALAVLVGVRVRGRRLGAPIQHGGGPGPGPAGESGEPA
jgi:hypothetical protein